MKNLKMVNLTTSFLLFFMFKCITGLPIERRDIDLEQGSERSKNTILGINRWVFISVVAFPFIFFFLCVWCWCIGRKSAKTIEENKKQRYVHEHRQNTRKEDGQNGSDTSSTVKKVINPQKEVEEEIRKHGNNSKKNTSKIETDENSVDIGSVKVNSSKASITSSPLIKDKMKKNNAPSPLLKFDAEKPRRPKKVNATAVVAARMDPTVPSSPRSSVSSIETSSIASSTQSTGSKKKGGKKKGGKKKKDSTQLGMSPVLSAPTSPYLNNVSTPVSPQLYYQQMYNAAAAAQVANPYLAAYNQSPYYSAAGVNVASTLANPYNTSPYLGARPATPTKTKKQKSYA